MMNEKNTIIIVGDGIAALLTAYFLIQKRCHIVLFSNNKTNKASLTAGAILNPNHPTNLSKTIKNTINLENNISIYNTIQSHLNTKFLQNQSIEILNDNCIKEKTWKGVYYLDIHSLQKSLLSYILSHSTIINEHFLHDNIVIEENSYLYKQIRASNIIFCEGAAGVNNPYLNYIPFTHNKGEMVIVNIPDAHINHIIQLGKMRLLPIGNNNYWIGTNHLWNDFSDYPTDIFYNEAMVFLSKITDASYKIIERKAAFRPTTAGQKTFVERIPSHENMIVINGLGSKGFTHAPFLIQQFIEANF